MINLIKDSIMKKVSDNIVCGPFVFSSNLDKLKKAYLEMCDEYPPFKKMFECGDKRIFVDVAVMGKGDSAEYKNQKILISHKILKNDKLIKSSLAHEYVHFTQDLNIQKTFPGLTLARLLSFDNFQVFLFFMFTELDAYLKSEFIYENNFIESMNVVNFAKFFEAYSCKFSNLDYADEFDFLNIKKKMLTKKEFIAVAECILNTFTGPEYGGEVFSKYNINWDEMFEVFEDVYVLNRNFDKIAKDKKYSGDKMYDFLYGKFNYDDAKRFILNYEFSKKANKSLLALNKKER